MNAPATTPAPQVTPACAGQLELFRPRPRPAVTISYTRPDADFDCLARLARAAITRKGD